LLGYLLVEPLRRLGRGSLLPLVMCWSMRRVVKFMCV